MNEQTADSRQQTARAGRVRAGLKAQGSRLKAPSSNRGFPASSLEPPASSLQPKQPSPFSLQPGAFTLVELLVVIAILGILVSLVTAGAQSARRKGAITRAKAEIAAMETAIAMYEGDLGEYPTTGNEPLAAALQEDPGDLDWEGPYMEFKHDQLKDGQVIDPWGNPYVYVSVNGGSPKHRERSFDLMSLGPNGVDDDGTGDDLVNW